MMTFSMSVILEQPVTADLTRLDTPQPCKHKDPSSASAAVEPSLRRSRRERFRIVLILDAVCRGKTKANSKTAGGVKQDNCTLMAGRNFLYGESASEILMMSASSAARS